MKYLFEYELFNEGISDILKSAGNKLTKENPEGSNRGKGVEDMQRKSGASAGDPWCAAFVYSVFIDANLPKEITSKIPKTPAVRILWEKSKASKIITKEEALKNPEKILPGMVFCYLSKNQQGKHGPAGHTGIVLKNHPKEKAWTGIEGNSNPIDGSREGYGTFLLKRKIEDPSISSDPKEKPALLLGFIDYLDGFREGKDYEVFIKNLEILMSKYDKFTKNEIQRLKSNPKILDIHADNYKNRFKKNEKKK
jgi:hypothetical protein